ncbi:MAG: AraC family transcriptional regulator [Chitinophagales bacterium]|nr:AraC family transcriptional regulator [Chitinophagales bacterium]
MFNLLEFVSGNSIFKQFKVNDLLFLEYKCVADQAAVKVWSKYNYFLYVVRGKKMWQSSRAKYCVREGEAIFVKKGANIIHQFFEEGFCSLMIFVPDDFISNVIKESSSHTPKCTVENTDTVICLHLDEVLPAYFHSVLSYFAKEEPPPGNLLEIKFKELILDLLLSPHNESLCSYLKSLCDKSKTSIREIMESNFIYNMKLEEFAYLSGRSITSFKKDFISTFNCTPGKWLVKRRLEQAKYLLEVTNKNINELVFETGFENASHFIRVFKQAYGLSPLQFKKSIFGQFQHDTGNTKTAFAK